MFVDWIGYRISDTVSGILILGVFCGGPIRAAIFLWSLLVAKALNRR